MYCTVFSSVIGKLHSAHPHLAGVGAWVKERGVVLPEQPRLVAVVARYCHALKPVYTR